MKRYKTYKIELTPTDAFPQMVTVTKGKTVNKKFVNKDKAMIWIDSSAAIQLINRGKRSVAKELNSIGFNYENSIAFSDEI